MRHATREVRRTGMTLLAAFVAATVLLAAPGRIDGSPRTAVLTIRAVDETGAALANATIAVSETGDNLVNQLLVTDGAGIVSATVPPGTYAATAFPPPTGGPATELLRVTAQGIGVSSDRSVDLILRRGIPLQACVRSDDGHPLAGARLDQFSTVFDLDGTAYTDTDGWFRLLVPADGWILVTPPPDGGLETSAWVRVADLAPDADGLAGPLVLTRIPEPAVEPDGVTVIYRGASQGPHVRIGFLSEGYTDGDEPFTDRNGNGRCDDEPYLDVDGDGRYDPFEPYSDANGNSRRDTEPFTDLNGDGVCNRDERRAYERAIADGVRMMLGYPCYRELADRIEVVAAFTPSNQAGSDFPSLSAPIERDTVFDSKFLSTNYIFNIDRIRIEEVGRERLGPTDVLAVMTNSLFEIGRESAGGTVLMFGKPRPDVAFTLAHELGHSVGRLADEYYEYDGAPPYAGNEPAFPNVTRTSALGTLKWSRFVRQATAVPSVDGTPSVGAFEGGYYHRHGIVRPTHSCLMRRYGPYCPVCADVMFTRLFALAETARPAEVRIIAPLDGAEVHERFAVGAVGPDLAPVDAIEILVDGVPAGGPVLQAPFGLSVDSSAFPNGSHRIEVAVRTSNGLRTVTSPVFVTVANGARPAPVPGVVEFRGGTLVFPQATGVELPGAVAIVDGKDRFPLERTAEGVLRVPKRALGSTSKLRMAKAVPKRRDVTVRLVNSVGGRSELLTFRR